jgi:hypothetical protein
MRRVATFFFVAGFASMLFGLVSCHRYQQELDSAANSESRSSEGWSLSWEKAFKTGFFSMACGTVALCVAEHFYRRAVDGVESGHEQQQKRTKH